MNQNILGEFALTDVKECDSNIDITDKLRKSDEYFKDRIEDVIATREWTKGKLRELGFSFPDSKSNFIFAKHDTVDAVKIFEELKTRGIYVRHFSKPERIANYLRISIGTDEEMQELIKELKTIVG